MENGENLLLENVEVTSGFWKRYRKLIAEVVLPYQYETLNDNFDSNIDKNAFADMRYYEDGLKSHAIENLKIAAGLSEGHHEGMNFQDTDVYKWLEAAAYTLKYYPNEDLQQKTDDIVDLIAQAQEKDGYLSTIFQIEMPERKFKRLEQSHELYSMGHYIEAGVAYYEVTGNQQALNIAKKMADCLDDNFGTEKGKIHGYGGHPEIELALMRLYEVTKEEKYLKLTDYFIRERGKDPEFFKKQNIEDGIENDFWPELRELGEEYYFADKPITEQTVAHGHAVRCVYFCTGLAHLARITQSYDLLKAANRLWKDIVKKQMYVTGNVGQTVRGEAFTLDYDLPNDTDYGETCASVAMAFFAKQMVAGEFKGEYADVIEKELYNGALSGISHDGKHYFYVNPLEVDPKQSRNGYDKKHILTRRQPWFGTACCPSNISRLIASVDQYLYEVKGTTILAHQYIANNTKFSHGISIEQESNLPWDGRVNFQIHNPENIQFDFAFRIPEWSKQDTKIWLNGEEIMPDVEKGIAYVHVEDQKVELELHLNMNVHTVRASADVKTDVGKVAIQRGPLVYCAEGTDNQEDLWKYRIGTTPHFEFDYEKELLDGTGVLTIDNSAVIKEGSEELYTFDQDVKQQQSRLKLIPYYAWANRDEGQMAVWMHE